jgi:hypothetical protein
MKHGAVQMKVSVRDSLIKSNLGDSGSTGSYRDPVVGLLPDSRPNKQSSKITNLQKQITNHGYQSDYTQHLLSGAPTKKAGGFFQKRNDDHFNLMREYSVNNQRGSEKPGYNPNEDSSIMRISERTGHDQTPVCKAATRLDWSKYDKYANSKKYVKSMLDHNASQISISKNQTHKATSSGKKKIDPGNCIETHAAPNDSSKDAKPSHSEIYQALLAKASFMQAHDKKHKSGAIAKQPLATDRPAEVGFKEFNKNINKKYQGLFSKAYHLYNEMNPIPVGESLDPIAQNQAKKNLTARRFQPSYMTDKLFPDKKTLGIKKKSPSKPIQQNPESQRSIGSKKSPKNSIRFNLPENRAPP